jgi:hypothetical protein
VIILTISNEASDSMAMSHEAIAAPDKIGILIDTTNFRNGSIAKIASSCYGHNQSAFHIPSSFLIRRQRA